MRRSKLALTWYRLLRNLWTPVAPQSTATSVDTLDYHVCVLREYSWQVVSARAVC